MPRTLLYLFPRARHGGRQPAGPMQAYMPPCIVTIASTVHPAHLRHLRPPVRLAHHRENRAPTCSTAHITTAHNISHATGANYGQHWTTPASLSASGSNGCIHPTPTAYVHGTKSYAMMSGTNVGLGRRGHSEGSHGMRHGGGQEIRSKQ